MNSELKRIRLQFRHQVITTAYARDFKQFKLFNLWLSSAGSFLRMGPAERLFRRSALATTMANI